MPYQRLTRGTTHGRLGFRAGLPIGRPSLSTRARARLGALLLLAAAAPAGAQVPARQRPFTIDDLLAIEGIGSVALSPDGAWVATVVRRRPAPQEQYQREWLNDSRGDIWLVRPDGTGRRNLTKGAATGDGYWDPVWSPDGSHLALLSTRGAGGVHVWAWSKAGDSLWQVASKLVDYRVVDATGDGDQFQPIAWLDASTLLLPLLPSSEGLGFPSARDAEETASRNWALARRGETPTSSRLEAGLASSYEPSVREDLVALDVTSGAMKVIGTVPISTTSSDERSFHLSPDRRTVAILTSRLEPPDPSRRLSRGMIHSQIGLAATDASAGVRWLDSTQGYLLPDYEVRLRWSGDGSRLLLAGRQVFTRDTTVRVLAVGARHGAAAQLLPPEWTTAEATLEETPASGPQHIYDWNAIWAPESGPVVLARRLGARRDWWLVRDASAPHNLTASLPHVPRLLVAGTLPHTAVTVDEAGIGVFDTRTGDLRSYSPDTSGAGSWQLLWPSEASLENRASRFLVLGRGTKQGNILVEADLGFPRPRFTRMGELPSRYSVVGYDPRSRTIVAGQRNREIVALSGGRRTTLLDVNRGAAEIAVPERRLISYRSTDGDSLKAVAVLPIGYVPGKRYPVVTWVYAGDVYATVDDVHVDPLTPGGLNLLLLASQGYILLYPSIPLGPMGGGGSDMREEIVGGVLPAVDKLVELGIADPARLAVMGQSFGGYTTLSLITSTRRFRTAIALASLVDEISLYGTFRFWDRYRGDSHPVFGGAKMAEAGQMRLGSHPWGDLWRYLKNSPVFYVDRVTTPVLLIHGDQDVVPIEGVEEFFTGLNRLGKRARFVRYWGEGHVLDSPANIRDMWQQVFEWLDETMPAAVSQPS